MIGLIISFIAYLLFVYLLFYSADRPTLEIPQFELKRSSLAELSFDPDQISNPKIVQAVADSYFNNILRPAEEYFNLIEQLKRYDRERDGIAGILQFGIPTAFFISFSYNLFKRLDIPDGIWPFVGMIALALFLTVAGFFLVKWLYKTNFLFKSLPQFDYSVYDLAVIYAGELEAYSHLDPDNWYDNYVLMCSPRTYRSYADRAVDAFFMYPISAGTASEHYIRFIHLEYLLSIERTVFARISLSNWIVPLVLVGGVLIWYSFVIL